MSSKTTTTPIPPNPAPMSWAQKFKALLQKRYSIAVKVSLTIALLLSITLGLLWVILQTHLESLLNNQINAFGKSITQQIANASGEMILADDLLSLNVIVNNLVSDPNIAHAAIYGNEDRLLAESTQQNRPNQIISKHFYTTPIFFEEVEIGEARITLDREPISRNVRHTMTLIGFATLLMLMSSCAITIALGKNLTRPVLRLKTGTKAITSGKLDYRINEDRKDEIGDLIRSFNHMAHNLEEKKKVEQAFSRFVSNDVADSILSNLSMPRMPDAYVTASVLFVDIVGFTTMCEKMPPQEVGKLLNNYFFYIHQACKLYNGTVDKYTGDGAMVLFGVPQEDPQHSYHAVCAAQLFIAVLERLNEKRRELNLPTAQFHLGLHSGSMLAGAIGSLERMQYTVIGDAVNVSARLCAESPDNTLIIGDTVMADDAVRRAVITEPAVSMPIRGRQSSIDTYEVKHLRPNHQEFIERQLAHILSLKVDA